MGKSRDHAWAGVPPHKRPTNPVGFPDPAPQPKRPCPPACGLPSVAGLTESLGMRTGLPLLSMSRHRAPSLSTGQAGAGRPQQSDGEARPSGPPRGEGGTGSGARWSSLTAARAPPARGSHRHHEPPNQDNTLGIALECCRDSKGHSSSAVAIAKPPTHTPSPQRCARPAPTSELRPGPVRLSRQLHCCALRYIATAPGWALHCAPQAPAHPRRSLTRAGGPGRAPRRRSPPQGRAHRDPAMGRRGCGARALIGLFLKVNLNPNSLPPSRGAEIGNRSRIKSKVGSTS